MKLHRKMKHYEDVCWAQELVFMFKVKATVGSEVKSCLCNNLKLAGANFIKLHKKVKMIRSYVAHKIYVSKLEVKVTLRLGNYSEKYQSKLH